VGTLSLPGEGGSFVGVTTVEVEGEGDKILELFKGKTRGTEKIQEGRQRIYSRPSLL